MNTANKITILRMILVPIFMILFAMDAQWSKFAALAVFILASATDSIDGHIARKYNQITTFGKFMDPLADKLLVTAALVMLVEAGTVSSWVAMIIIAREFAVTGFRVIAASNGTVIAASFWGKLKTVTQMTAIIFAMVFAEKLVVFGIEISIAPCIAVLMWVAAIITIISGVDYIVKNKDVLKNNVEK